MFVFPLHVTQRVNTANTFWLGNVLDDHRKALLCDIMFGSDHAVLFNLIKLL